MKTLKNIKYTKYIKYQKNNIKKSGKERYNKIEFSRICRHFDWERIERN